MILPTQKQLDVLSYLWSFYRSNDQLPPAHVICAHFGWSSKNAACEVLAALERKGYLARNTVGKYRFSPMFHAEQEAATEAAGVPV